MTTDGSDLQRRIARLEDELALRDLLARYAFTADARRVADWVALWTDDGELDPGSGPPFRGKDALRAALEQTQIAEPGRYQHDLTGPVTFDIGEDVASAVGYGTVSIVGATGPAEVNVSFNRWHFRRVEGTWRIAARHRRVAGASNWADVTPFSEQEGEEE